MRIQTYLSAKHSKRFKQYMKLLEKKEYQLAQELILAGLDTYDNNIEIQASKKEKIIKFLKKDWEKSRKGFMLKA